MSRFSDGLIVATLLETVIKKTCFVDLSIDRHPLVGWQTAVPPARTHSCSTTSLDDRQIQISGHQTVRIALPWATIGTVMPDAAPCGGRIRARPLAFSKAVLFTFDSMSEPDH